MYDGLFTETVAEQGASHTQGFGKKWGWYQSIYALAKGDVRYIEEVTKLPFQQCFLWLEFEKDKNDIEAKMLKSKR